MKNTDNNVSGVKEFSASGVDYPHSALLIVDMLSDFDFKDGEKLFENTVGILENIKRLTGWARSGGRPVLYINDSYGKSEEEFRGFLSDLREKSSKARTVMDSLEPADDDHIILKPQHSGFFATALGTHLMTKKVKEVIVVGVTTDICVMFTAHDAFMRGINVRVPEDCCAAVKMEHHVNALSHLERVAEADTLTSEALFGTCTPQNGNGSEAVISENRFASV